MTGSPRETALAARVLSQQEASEGLRRAGLLAGRVLLVGAALLAWSAASGTVVDAQFVSDSLSVARALAALAASDRLWPNLGQTVAEVLIGYFLSGVLGVAVALLAGVPPSAQRALCPFLLAFYAIPKIALAPLIVIWFGIGLAPKVLLVTVFVFFALFMNVVTYGTALQDRHPRGRPVDQRVTQRTLTVPEGSRVRAEGTGSTRALVAAPG